MERLTWQDCYDGIYAENIIQQDYDGATVFTGEAIDRLAAYENTGLEPEEVAPIMELAEKMNIVDLVRENLRMANRLRHAEARLNSLSVLIKARDEGRVVELDMPRKPLVWGDDDHDTCLCPDCGEDLMGIPYGERMILQCPVCGQYLDATKIVFCNKAKDRHNETDILQRKVSKWLGF